MKQIDSVDSDTPEDDADAHAAAKNLLWFFLGLILGSILSNYFR
jgi:hypothetical protein